MSGKLLKSKARVYHGTIEKTSGGLSKASIKRVSGKDGSVRYVSKKKSALATKRGAATGTGPLARWRKAVTKARKELGIKENIIAPSNKKASRTYNPSLYKKAKSLYDASC